MGRRAANRAGGNFPTFRCARCGATTTRRKSLAVVGAERSRGQAAPRVCRDAEACAERKRTAKNVSVLREEAE